MKLIDYILASQNTRELFNFFWLLLTKIKKIALIDN